MTFLTLQLALSSISFLYNSPMFLSQIEFIPEFDTAWEANLDLAVAMAKDNRIAEILESQKWALLQDTSIFVDRNDSHLILFSVIEDILRIYKVERIVEVYPNYKFALLTTTQLAVSITEFYQPPGMKPDNWKQLLSLTRLENNLAKDLDCRDVTSVTSNQTEIIKNEKEENKGLKEDSIVTELRKHAINLVPTTIDYAIHLLHTGFHFKLPFMAERSAKFLEESLSMENVVEIYHLSTLTQMKDLHHKAEDFIAFEFEEISKEDKRFLSLQIGELFSLLMSEKLTIRSEESVFKAIVRWVYTDLETRTEHLTTLMKAVRLHLCPISTLNMMLDHYLLKDFKDIQFAIRSAVYLVQLNSPKLPDLIKKQQRLQRETLFVMSGITTGQSSVTIETFSTSKQEWIFHDRFNNASTKNHTSSVPIGHKCILFLHKQYSVSSFDPIKKEWEYLSNVPNQRYFFSVSALNDLIYVLGGITNEKATNICERYDPKSGSWTKLPSLNTPRYFASAATMRGKVYIAGGIDTAGNTLNSVEVFDPDMNHWSFKKPMNTPRRSFALMAEGNSLWAFGGHYTSNLNDVEKYDIEGETWSNTPAMPTPRRGLAAVYFYGNFYVIGVYEGNGERVDVFNPCRKTWTKVSDLSFSRSYPGVCVIKDLPNAVDYLIYET